MSTQNRSFWCPSCGFKSPTADGLILGKGGCSSCGKSGYKCPRCGMGMKIQRSGPPPQARLEPPAVRQRGAIKETAVKSTPIYEKAWKKMKITRAR